MSASRSSWSGLGLVRVRARLGLGLVERVEVAWLRQTPLLNCVKASMIDGATPASGGSATTADLAARRP